MDHVTPQPPKPRRTKPRGRHPHNRLAAAFVRSAPVGRHADGNGLYLYVQRTGTRSWVQRLVIRGRKRELGLGSVHLVSLAEAREQARANRKLARAGGDPLVDKRRLEAMPTFAEAAATVVEQKRAGWRSPRAAADWLGSLERYVFPRIGSRPVSEVSSADLLAVLTPIWHVKSDTARRLRQRIGAVLEWSIAMEHRTDNPCDRIGPVLGPQRDIVRHMRALPHQDVAAGLETVRASRATSAVKLAFEFLVVTAARSGEVRLATWEEMNVAARGPRPAPPPFRRDRPGSPTRTRGRDGARDAPAPRSLRSRVITVNDLGGQPRGPIPGQEHLENRDPPDLGPRDPREPRAVTDTRTSTSR